MAKPLVGTEPGLVAYYPMEEGTGQTTSDPAGGNHGSIVGPVWSTDVAF